MLHRIVGTGKNVYRRLYSKAAGFAEREAIGKKKELYLADVFFMQFCKEEFLRYDIVVRYLAVENYYGKNGYGWDMYRKMQDARIGQGYSDVSEEKFRELIRSYEKDGYRGDSSIIVDKELSLVDGSHRMALHIYHDLPMITAVVLPMVRPVDYTVDWFFQCGFTDSELDIIFAKARELTERLNRPFSCVIWSPAVGKTEQIIKDLSYFGTVCGYREHIYRPEEYKNIVRAVYAVDDIADWKIEKKLEHMRAYPPALVEVDLKLAYPDFRIKGVSGMPLSRTGERVKKSLRARFQPYVEDYFPDIILHTADNYMQSDYMHYVFDPGIDFTKVLNILKEYDYALAKTDSPYYPADFPRHISVGKDVDVLCRRSDCEAIFEKLRVFSQGYPNYEVRTVPHGSGVLIRFEKMHRLIFQIDLGCTCEGLSEDFVGAALDERVKAGGYYKFSAEFEYLYRAASFFLNRSKTHHLDYLRSHQADYSPELAEEYWRFDTRELKRLLGEQ